MPRRASTLRKHAGQVVFPGGAADSSDASLIATALREAQEEVSIAPEVVTVLGTLPPLDSVSGFQVKPVVGLLPANIRVVPNADEVAELFEMPLTDAFSLARYYPLDIERQRQTHRVYLSWYRQQAWLNYSVPVRSKCALPLKLVWSTTSVSLAILSQVRFRYRALSAMPSPR